MLWLKQGQNPQGIHQKSVERNLAAAGIFGVEAILADKAACERFALSEATLIDGVNLIENTAETLEQYQHVVFSG